MTTAQKQKFLRQGVIQSEQHQVILRIQQRIDYLGTVQGDQSDKIAILEQYQLIVMRAKLK